MKNSTGDKIGMFITGLVIVLSTVALIYMGYLAQDQDFIDKHPAKKNCNEQEYQIAGYCCRDKAQFDTGNCTY